MKFTIQYLLFALIGKTADCVNQQTPKIKGGHDAFPGQFPWMVSFQELNKNNQVWEHDCGGAIIDHRHIISAAHCYQYTKGKFRVVAGAHNISQPDSAETSRQVLKPCRINTHPDWDYLEYTNDMMVITLEKPLLFNERVQPIRLAPPDSNPVGQVCVLSGWGFMDHGLKEQNLQTLNMTVISLDECMPWAESSPFKIDKFNVCARSVMGGQPRGGDSGSPLVCYDDKGPYVTAVVSWGPSDDGNGQVFGGVKEQLDFIKCSKNKG